MFAVLCRGHRVFLDLFASLLSHPRTNIDDRQICRVCQSPSPATGFCCESPAMCGPEPCKADLEEQHLRLIYERERNEDNGIVDVCEFVDHVDCIFADGHFLMAPRVDGIEQLERLRVAPEHGREKEADDAPTQNREHQVSKVQQRMASNSSVSRRCSAKSVLRPLLGRRSAWIEAVYAAQQQAQCNHLNQQSAMRIRVATRLNTQRSELSRCDT